MKYTTLGSTGLQVSRICVGCMGFGRSREWFLDEDESREIVDRALDLGINFFDTSNSYSSGDSEQFLGNALEGYDREEVVVTTKGYYGVDDAPENGKGLSRKAIDHQLAGSLDRLGLETVDLYLAHAWDYGTPISETLGALTDAVERRDTRYIGLSKTWAHQLAQSLHVSELEGLERFVAMQNLYNLVYREEEREMLPLCEREGVGVTPFSPLMRGYLARPDAEMESTSRGKADRGRRDRWSPDSAGTHDIKARAEELAEQKGISVAQLSLSWLFHKPVVDAPVLGVTSVEHLEDAAAALEVSLSSSELEYLEEPYTPVEIIGHE